MELKNPLPDLTKEELRELEDSIARDGIITPIIKSAGPACFGEIVDGHNRAAIAEKLGIKDIPIVSRRYQSEAEFRIEQIDLNMKRRQLTPFARTVLALERVPWEQKLAKERRGIANAPDTGRATEKAARAGGTSRKTLENSAFVIKNAPPEILQHFQKNEIRPDRAFRETKKALGLDAATVLKKSLSQKFTAAPEGPFASIVVDPPWRDARENNGAALTPQEIRAVPVTSLLAESGVVYLWTPTSRFGEATAMFAEWGLNLVGAIHWLHEIPERESFFREHAELCLVGIRGRIESAGERARNVVFGEPTSASVRLPKEFLELVEHLRPDGRQLLIFGDIEREHWTRWQLKTSAIVAA
ncbi:MAG: hypothetical protein NVS2B17_31110 [Candidatus Velthaea sp.]